MKVPGYLHADGSGLKSTHRKAINEGLAAGRYPLLFSGPRGTGKTCAAACLYESIAAKDGGRPLWFRADDVLRNVAHAGYSGAEIDRVEDDTRWIRETIKTSDFWNRVEKTRCVFLDDLGIEKPTDRMVSTLFNMLERRQGRMVAITTNLNAADLTKWFDDRITDRLCAGTVIQFKGQSRRKKQP